MKPIFDESGVTLYCGDSRLIIPELPVYDLLVTDPPYCNGYKTNALRCSPTSTP
jgi:DNA modification methylase